MPLGLFPLPSSSDLASMTTRLVRALKTHDYEKTWSIPTPGRPWHLLREPKNLTRFMSGGNNAFECSPWSALYRRAYASRKPSTVILYEALHLGQPQDRGVLASALGDDLLREMERLEMLVPHGSKVISRAKLTGFDPLVVLSDTTSIHANEKSSFVFCGRCSSRLGEAVRVEMTTRGRGKRSLDLCTGSGIQALNGAAWFDEVWGGDLNPRAVAFATANAAANGVDHARFVQSDLFANLEGTFDLITANTPFLLLDEGSQALDGYGGKYGMEVELRLFEALDRYLAPGGSSLIVASSAFVEGRNRLEDALREMFAGKDYAIDLFPISQYYSPDHFHAYESQNVAKCILYIVRLRKDASAGLTLDPHPYAGVEAVSLDVKVQLQRQIARRRYMKQKASAHT